MVRLEDLAAGARVSGIIPEQQVTVIDVKWHGQAAIELFYKPSMAKPAASCCTGRMKRVWRSAHPKGHGALIRMALPSA